jgi:pyruvate dehydrogenase (quinone)
MHHTVSDSVIRLQDRGIRRIYGYPADGINGLTDALRKTEDLSNFVQVRHEEMAVFMAGAHAKFTGRFSVYMATGRTGAFHHLNGLYDATLDYQPVLLREGQAQGITINLEAFRGGSPEF